MDRIKESPPGTRRKFDPTFKREAVRKWLASGKSAAVVSKELGLGEGLLFAWRKLFPGTAASFRRSCRPMRSRHLSGKVSATFAGPAGTPIVRP